MNLGWGTASEQVVLWLLRASWQGTVLIVVVLVVQSLFRRWLSPRLRYALWALAAFRLLVPVLPASPVSVFNLAPTPQLEVARSAAEPGSQVSPPAPTPELPAEHPETATPRSLPGDAVRPRRQWTWTQAALTVWALGALALVAQVAWSTTALRRRVR